MRILSLLFLVSVQAWSYPGNVIITPKSARGVTQLQAVLGHPLVQSKTPLLSASERRFVAEQGDSSLAYSTLISVKDEASFRKLKDWGKKSAPGISIDRNVPVNSNSNQDPFFRDYRWHLDNDPTLPRRIGISYDDITTLFIDRVKGEDLGLISAPPLTSAGRSVKVAILDTGMDFNHPALHSQITSNSSECVPYIEYQQKSRDAKATRENCKDKSNEVLEACKQDKTKEINLCRTEADARVKACVANFNEEKSKIDLTYLNIDSDHNGYPLDCHGWNLTGPVNTTFGVLGNMDASDLVGHGTHVAGLVTDVDPNASLVPVQIMAFQPNAPLRPQDQSENHPSRDLFADPSELPSPIEAELKKQGVSPEGFVDTVGRGMLYALVNHAEVVNLSLNWPPAYDTEFTRRIFALATHPKGNRPPTIVVSSAGNDSNSAASYPCSYSGVICVASTGPDGAISHFSNYGPAVDLAAPGFAILSTFPTSMKSRLFNARKGFEIKSGTSMSAPLVTGMVSRMLSQGIPPTEIMPRLLIGTRPHRKSDLRGEGFEPKYTRSGNADLGLALQVSPIPLILPASKEAISLAWNAIDSQLPIQFSLKNYWKSAGKTEIRIKLLTPTGLALSGMALSESSWTFDHWSSQESKSISTSLISQSPLMSGRVQMSVSVIADSVSREFRIPIELSIPIDPVKRLEIPHATYPISGEIMDDPETLRTISGLGPDSDPDYLVVKREAKTWTLQLLKRTGLGYTFDPAVTLDALAGPNDTLLPTRKIDWLGTGVPQIQISLSVIQTDPRKRSGRFLRFYIFDQNLGLVSKFEYLNTETVPTERFQMLKLAGTKNWAPAWISAGKAPPTEIPAYNPWKPYPIDRFEYRFYYLTQDSVLHSVQAPEKYTFIKLLFQTTDQRVAGEVPVLLSTGKDYYVKYATAVVRGNQVQDLKPLDLPQFQNLISVSPYNSLDVLSLDSSHSEVQGSLFFGKAHRGAIQISLIPALSGNAPLSGTLNPATFTDSMVSVTGAFFGEGKGSVFAQTHYELQYHDLISGQVALTSVNRYTFLPTFLSERSSYPVVISQSGKLTAGTYFPDGLGDTPSIEVVVPVESQGKISLGIPAKFRFLTTEACPLASNPIAPRAGNPSKLVLFCRDRFVRIPLIY